MSERDFIPHRDADLNDWSRNFAKTLSANYAGYGESPQQAAAYAALDAVWRAAYTRSINAATRGPSATAAKKTARAAVQALARLITRRVQGTPAVTDEMKINLGVRVSKRHATPTVAPATPPMMKIVETRSRTVKVKFVSDTVDTRCGRERGTAGVSVFIHRGPITPGHAGRLDPLGQRHPQHDDDFLRRLARRRPGVVHVALVRRRRCRPDDAPGLAQSPRTVRPLDHAHAA